MGSSMGAKTIELIPALLMLVAFILLAGCLQPSYQLRAVGTGPGWLTLVLNSSQPIESARLEIIREAKLLNCSGNCYFSYWVSPKDPSGEYTARFTANGQSGKLEVNISNNATWIEKNGLVFYWPGDGNSESVNATLTGFLENETAVMVFLEPGKTDRNAEAVKAEVILVATLTALNKTTHVYLMLPSEKNCTYLIAGNNETESLPYDRCISEAYPTVVIHIPSYPTTQVLVNGTRFQIQSEQGKLIEASKKLAEMIIDAQKLFK